MARVKAWLGLAASIGLVLVLVLVAGVVVAWLRSADDPCVADGLSMQSPPAEPGKPAEPAECVGVTGSELSDQFDPELNEAIERIATQNRAATYSDSGSYVDVALLGPLSPPKQQQPGQPEQVRPMTSEQVRQMLIGAAVAQQRVNESGSGAGERFPPIRLLLANSGRRQNLWETAFEKLGRLADGRLVAVIALGTSVDYTQEAAKKLTAKGIPVIGATVTADDFDHTKIDGMIRVAPDTHDFVAALADYLGPRYGRGSAQVVWDKNSHNGRGDLYAGSLKGNFEDQLKTWIREGEALGFDGEYNPSPGQPPSKFFHIVEGICKNPPRVILYAGRVPDLKHFIADLLARTCKKTEPLVVMTGVLALTDIDNDNDMVKELPDANLTIVTAGVLDPHNPDGERDGFLRYLQALNGSGLLNKKPDHPDHPDHPDQPDAYTCLAHDAVFTARRAIYTAITAGRASEKYPTHDEVRSQLLRLGEIPGCSGTFSFDEHGKPLGTPTPIVVIPAAADPAAKTTRLTTTHPPR
ncbi:hypothetical protein OG225_06960 [Nocardia sp. NBC_01377]|uniref:hypothetical protein n=1 Tax=Nocardia sp. NBC_01377 TaxID=2903595 RepID=UPI003250C906